MNLGDIVRNDWAGDGNPIKYFIYTGISGRYATGLYVSGNEIRPVRYYKEEMKTDKFVVVGHCNYRDVIIGDLKKAGE